jgi:hypothetical protein
MAMRHLRSVAAMDARERIATAVGRNRALLRQAAGTWLYSNLLCDEATQAILRACAAHLHARQLLLHRPMQRPDDELPGDRYAGSPAHPVNRHDLTGT